MSSFILCNNKPFLNQIVMYNEKCILHANQWQLTQWFDQGEAPKHFPKPNLHPKKAYDHCLVVCCWSDPLQLSESQWNHYNWEVGSVNWWDALKTATPATIIVQQKRPSSSPQPCLTARYTTNASKIERIGLQSFASSAIFTNLPLLTTSCRENASTTSRMQKMLSEGLPNPEAWIFMLLE